MYGWQNKNIYTYIRIHIYIPIAYHTSRYTCMLSNIPGRVCIYVYTNIIIYIYVYSI